MYPVRIEYFSNRIMHKSRLSSHTFVSFIFSLFLARFTSVLCDNNERCRKSLLHKDYFHKNETPIVLTSYWRLITFSRSLILGNAVSVSDSSFSLNEYWNDVDDSSRDEGYLELQWDLPKDMSLAEKFVLRFDEFLSKRGINRSENVFQVGRIPDVLFTRCILQYNLLLNLN